jgi:hypothetical protein
MIMCLVWGAAKPIVVAALTPLHGATGSGEANLSALA